MQIQKKTDTTSQETDYKAIERARRQVACQIQIQIHKCTNTTTNTNTQIRKKTNTNTTSQETGCKAIKREQGERGHVNGVEPSSELHGKGEVRHELHTDVL